MDKPIVFFSHSSKDEKILKKLKKAIDDKTGEAIDIFLSSDGQSIPFGTNWVYKLQEALEKTSLMFTFVSPNSLQSNWIYFESGYVSAKDIDVIPVGISGVDLSKIAAPLSLLQGFNLHTKTALGNIISVINKTYDTKFKGEFSSAEFEDIFNQKSSWLSLHGLPIDGVSMEIDRALNENEIDYLKEKLEEKNLSCVMRETISEDLTKKNTAF